MDPPSYETVITHIRLSKFAYLYLHTINDKVICSVKYANVKRKFNFFIKNTSNNIIQVVFAFVNVIQIYIGEQKCFFLI